MQARTRERQLFAFFFLAGFLGGGVGGRGEVEGGLGFESNRRESAARGGLSGEALAEVGRPESYAGQAKFGGVGISVWLFDGGAVSGVSSPTSFDCCFALPFGHSCGVSICAALDSRPWP